MNRSKLAVLTVVILALSSVSAHAATADKKAALEAVKNYATSIACSTTFDKNSENEF